MRRLLVVLVLVLGIAGTTDAASKVVRKACQARCRTAPADGGGAFDAIAECQREGGKLRKCRRTVLRDCYRRGPDLACGPQGQVTLGHVCDDCSTVPSPGILNVTVFDLGMRGRGNPPLTLRPGSYYVLDAFGTERYDPIPTPAGNVACGEGPDILPADGIVECRLFFLLPFIRTGTLVFEQDGYRDTRAFSLD